jgi:hypothetical protein
MRVYGPIDLQRRPSLKRLRSLQATIYTSKVDEHVIAK